MHPPAESENIAVNISKKKSLLPFSLKYLIIPLVLIILFLIGEAGYYYFFIHQKATKILSPEEISEIQGVPVLIPPLDETPEDIQIGLMRNPEDNSDIFLFNLEIKDKIEVCIFKNKESKVGTCLEADDEKSFIEILAGLEAISWIKHVPNSSKISIYENW